MSGQQTKRKSEDEGVTTRSKTKKHKNGVCPISLEPLHFCTSVFIHDGISFDANRLHEYLIKNPDAPNPITRQPFSDQELESLNSIVSKPEKILTGCDRVLEASKIKERDEMIEYFSNEAVSILNDLEWISEEDDFCDGDIDYAISSMMEIKRDFEKLTDGEKAWEEFHTMLKKDYVSDETKEVLEYVATTIFGRFGRPPPEIIPPGTERHYTPPPYTEVSPIVADQQAARTLQDMMRMYE